MLWLYCLVILILLYYRHQQHLKTEVDLMEIIAHQDQSIDYLLKQDSIAHPENWKR